MARSLLHFIGLAWLITVSAIAGCATGDVSLESSKADAGSDHAGSQDGFTVRHVLTHEPDQLFADWAKPAKGAPVNSTDKAVRGQIISSMLLFSGCKADAGGHCDVATDIEITDPLGAVYGEFGGVEVWINKPPPKKGVFQLNRSDIRMVVEPGEPLGEYRISASTTDRVAGITLKTERRFEVLESPLSYSTVPLRQPIYGQPDLTVQIETYDGWLSENLEDIAAADVPAAREHLFALIDSLARNRFAADGVLYAEEDGEDMKMLFSRAEELGTYGGSLVLNQLVGVKEPLPQTKVPPNSFGLTLDGTDFTLTSKLAGWSVSYPYNFMLWTLADFTPPNAARTQSVSLSTGFAHHAASREHSQATILLFYSSDKDTAWLEKDMRAYYGIPTDADAVETELPGLTAYKFFNEERNLRVEYLRIDPAETKEGALVAVYLGIDGTYQWNRPHFLDFLRSLTASLQ